MQFKEFGKSSFNASSVGLGTWFGRTWLMLAYPFKIHRNSKRSIEAMQIGLNAGINLIDTAEIYRSEPIVAEAIKGINRDELFIASKVWTSNLHYDSVLRACDNSLKRLNTTYIDLYQIHWPTKKVPIEETMRAMERLVDDGKIKHIGVSNFSLNEMIEAEDALNRNELTSTQMSYNLANRDIESDILPHCEDSKIAMMAYCPIASGTLSGAMMNSTECYRKISKKHGGKTPAQVALNWLTVKSKMVFPIPRASNPTHVKENVNAVGWELDQHDVDLLEKKFPI